MHYTLDELKQKNLKELKEIGYQLNVFPEDDRRYARNWIKALTNAQPPLLQLLESSAAVEVEPVQEAIEQSAKTSPDAQIDPIEVQALASSFQIGDLVESVHERWGLEEESLIGTVILIHRSGGVRVNFGPGGTFDYSRPGKDLIKTSIAEVQVQDAIETPPGGDAKFGRITYPKPIAQNAETRPQLDRTESADVHNRGSHPAESFRDSSGAEAETLGSQEGDRVLAVARDSQAVRGRVLPHQPIELALNDERPPNRGDGKGWLEIEPKLSQSAIEVQAQEPIKEEFFDLEELWELDTPDCPACGGVDSLYAVRSQEYANGFWNIHCNRCYSGCSTDRLPPCLDDYAVEEAQRQEPIETPPGVESKFGRIVYPKPAAKPIAQTEKITPGEADGNATESDRLANLRTHSHCPGADTAELHGSGSGVESTNSQHEEGDRVLAAAGNAQTGSRRALRSQPTELAATLDDERPPNRGDGKSRIEQAAKTSTVHQLLELFKAKAHIVEDSPGVKTEQKASQSAIVPAAENIPGADCVYCTSPEYESLRDDSYRCYRCQPDPNPILTGIPLSDNFLARYSPPQSETIHFQSDEDGQLSLLNFEVESADEPPDPDDFCSIDAFREAMARWDAENAEALAVTMDSMCEWAPCPHEWYEPEGENLPLKASSMRELSPLASESSSTCNFSIPTFDTWCDRPSRHNDSDEPPDTGNYAKLPGPKPPKFPPRAIGQVSLSQGKSASRNYPETIPKLSHCIAAAGNSRLGRSPPGGDAM